MIVESPENNSSVSSLLKNTLDWLSRAIGDGQGVNAGAAPYLGKLAALISASPGAYGGHAACRTCARSSPRSA